MDGQGGSTDSTWTGTPGFRPLTPTLSHPLPLLRERAPPIKSRTDQNSCSDQWFFRLGGFARIQTRRGFAGAHPVVKPLSRAVEVRKTEPGFVFCARKSPPGLGFARVGGGDFLVQTGADKQ